MKPRGPLLTRKRAPLSGVRIPATAGAAAEVPLDGCVALCCVVVDYCVAVLVIRYWLGRAYSGVKL
jgi:hypothetical protein